MSSPVRRVEVPPQLAAAHAAGAAGRSVYASAFALPIAGHTQPRSAEQWARAVFEGAPTLLRTAILFGWRFFLRLRLEPLDAPAQVLGWRLEGDATGAETVTLAADSPLLRAENIVDVDGTVVLWVTVVHFEGRLGRVLWNVASAMHHLVIPYLVRRAAVSSTPEPAMPGVSANGHVRAQP